MIDTFTQQELKKFMKKDTRENNDQIVNKESFLSKRFSDEHSEVLEEMFLDDDVTCRFSTEYENENDD